MSNNTQNGRIFGIPRPDEIITATEKVLNPKNIPQNSLKLGRFGISCLISHGAVVMCYPEYHIPDQSIWTE